MGPETAVRPPFTFASSLFSRSAAYVNSRDANRESSCVALPFYRVGVARRCARRGTRAARGQRGRPAPDSGKTSSSSLSLLPPPLRLFLPFIPPPEQRGVGQRRKKKRKRMNGGLSNTMKRGPRQLGRESGTNSRSIPRQYRACGSEVSREVGVCFVFSPPAASRSPSRSSGAEMMGFRFVAPVVESLRGCNGPEISRRSLTLPWARVLRKGNGTIGAFSIWWTRT